MIKKIVSLFAVVCVLFAALPAIAGGQNTADITVLFTSDMHAAILPKTVVKNGEPQQMGGFAKVAEIIQQNYVQGSTLVLDSGDFSMGTLFQTLFETKSTELSLMGQMGYDVVAIGNHEFDMGADVLKNSLESADRGTMEVVCSSIFTSKDKVSVAQDSNALASSGVRSYVIKEIQGVKIGIFSVMGHEASKYIFADEYYFDDYVSFAQKMVDHLKTQEKVDAVILLSHCGTNANPKQSEDEILAQKVEGIDLIISGHSHISSAEPIKIKDTVIVEPGAKTLNVGKVKLSVSKGGKNTVSWDKLLTPTDGSVPEKADTAELIKQYQQDIQTGYLDKIDKSLTPTTPVAHSGFTTMPIDAVQQKLGNYPIGDIITDAYQYAIQELAGLPKADISLTPVGVIRADITEGTLTVSDVYDILSYGISPRDGLSGSSLGIYYVKGEDLPTICEVDVSISPMMSGAQLFYGGLKYEYLEGRLPFNKVVKVYVYDREKQEYLPAEKDKLYSVVMTSSTAQLVGVVGEQSMGLLDLTIRNADGSGMEKSAINSQIIQYEADGEQHEIKEWYALEQYMASFEKGPQGLPEIPAEYETAKENKIIMQNPGPGAYISNPGNIFWILLIACFVIMALIVLVFFLVIRRRNKKNSKKKAGKA